MAVREQPTKYGLFSGTLHRGTKALTDTIRGTWSTDKATIHAENELLNNYINGKSPFHLKKAAMLPAMIFTGVFGVIIIAVTTLIHELILLIVAVITCLVTPFAASAHRRKMRNQKISTACPNPDCQARFQLPAYACPTCGRVHTNLVPGKYGLWRRTCLCDTDLPTTYKNGLAKLPAYCPVCGNALSGDTGCQQYAIPVTGGPGAGKTCLINMAADKLMNEAAPANNWDIHFISESDKYEHLTIMGEMKRGIRPAQTDKEALTPYQLIARLPDDKIGKRVYIYDISGEKLSESGTIQRNRAFSYADGIVFVIDPLTIPDFALKMVDKADPDAYGSGAKYFEDIFDIMLNDLQTVYGIQADDVLKCNLAIVINKCDIPGLETEIGEEAVQQYLKTHSECSSSAEAKNEVCKAFLDLYGEGNFVREADSKFSRVQYFTCSALGHNREDEPFEGQNVTEPFLWILQKAAEE